MRRRVRPYGQDEAIRRGLLDCEGSGWQDPTDYDSGTGRLGGTWPSRPSEDEDEEGDEDQ